MISSERTGLPFLMAPCVFCGRMTTRLLDHAVGVHVSCEYDTDRKPEAAEVVVP